MTHPAPDIAALADRVERGGFDWRCDAELTADILTAAPYLLAQANRAQRMEAALRWFFGADTIKDMDKRLDLLHAIYFTREDGSEVEDPIDELLKRYDEALK